MLKKQFSIGLILLLALSGAGGCSFIKLNNVHRGELLAGNDIVYGATGPVVLTANPLAADPTYDELVAFLNSDPTDQYPYVEGVRVCAEFAQAVYNNAEAGGIRAAFVMLTGVDHALNAFETTDKGLVYVDCTGEETGSVSTVPSRDIIFGQPASWDKIAYVQVGSPVGLISLSTALNYGLDYPAYTHWLAEYTLFEQELAQSESEQAGRTVLPRDEYNKLKAEQQVEIDLANKLGAFWEGPDATGVVTNVYVFWQGHS